MIDDKLRILDTMKKIWGERVTTVFPRQGHYATDPEILAQVSAWRHSAGPHRGPGRTTTFPTIHEALTREHATVKATEQLHDLGQSLWLDNITRDLLTSGTLQRYIDELSVTGLTSNPTIFDHAVAHSTSYDAEIRRLVDAGKSGEALFFELAIQDLTKAADTVRADPSADRRRGWLGVAGGLAAARP